MLVLLLNIELILIHFYLKHNFTTAETESFQSPEQIVKENQILKLNEKKENEDKRRQSVVEIEQNKSLPPVVEVGKIICFF